MTGRPDGASRSRSSSPNMVFPAPSTPSMPTRTVPSSDLASTEAATRSSTAARAGVTTLARRGSRGSPWPTILTRYVPRRRRITRSKASSSASGISYPPARSLAGREPAPHPLRADRSIAEAERDHEDHREALERAAAAPGALFQMTARGADRRRIEPDHEKRPVGDLPGQLRHARAGGQQVDGRGRGAPVPEARRGRPELDGVTGQKPPQLADGLAHEGHRGARLPQAPRRDEAGRHREHGAARTDLIQAMGERGEDQRMPDDGARRGREQPQAARRLGRERQRQVDVAAARGMVVDADAVEAGVLAAGDERGQLGQGPAHRDAEVDAQAGQRYFRRNPTTCDS